ncbi:MAG: hypothetical protein WCC10_17755 [Tumebacillaceae bacterium]
MNNSTKILLSIAILCVVGFGGTIAYAMLAVPAQDKPAANAPGTSKKTDPNKASLDNFFAAWKQGDKEQAKKQIGALLKLTPNDPNLQLINADFQRFYTGKPDDSIATLREMVSFYTDDPKPYAALARHLAEVGEHGDRAALNEAQGFIATAIKMTQERGEEVLLSDWETQAWISGLSGKVDEALEKYATRVFQHPAYTVDNPAYMLHYAALLEQGGHLEEAVEVYHDIRDLMVTQMDEQGRADLEWAQTNARNALQRLTDQ